MSRIGEKVSSSRIALGMTKKQLAKILGVSEKFIEEIETGTRVLNDDLLKRVSKALGQDALELMIYGAEEETKKAVKDPKKPVKQEIQDVWNDAFELVFKTIPVYDYSISKALYTKQLPIVDNKVEGHAKDKVLFLEVQDNDMAGFRMLKGDVAFAYTTHEIKKSGIFLIEYGGERAIRQIKKLDSSKILIVSNKGSLTTESVLIRDIKVLAKLEWLEIKL